MSKEIELEHRSDKATRPEDATSAKNKRPWILLAFLAILLTGLVYFFWSSGQTMETRPGERKELIIADGTKVQLSPGSNLGFDSTEWAVRRAMSLEGQALFQVSEGTPFTVQTDQGLVEVLGTQFDIWAMGDLMRVQCFEGKVQVSIPGSEQPLTLTVGQQLYVNKSIPGAVESFEATEADWLRGERLYQKTPLSLVIKDIERFFAVQLDTKSVNTAVNFSGRIPIPDLDKALDYLCRSMKWKYERNNTNIVFSKE